MPVGSVTNFPVGGQVDFRVRALIGHPYVEQEGLIGIWYFLMVKQATGATHKL